MESGRESFNCNKCVYSTKRSYNLKRHILSEHIADRNSGVSIKTSDGLPKRPRIQETDDDVYTKKEYEETMDTLDGTTKLCVRIKSSRTVYWQTRSHFEPEGRPFRFKGRTQETLDHARQKDLQHKTKKPTAITRISVNNLLIDKLSKKGDANPFS